MVIVVVLVEGNSSSSSSTSSSFGSSSSSSSTSGNDSIRSGSSCSCTGILIIYPLCVQVALGGYVLQDFGVENSAGSGGPLPHPTLIIIGTGTEVYLAVGAAQVLCSEGGGKVWVRVVSMPSCELFDRQPLDYQRSVLIAGAPVMSVEASGVVRHTCKPPMYVCVNICMYVCTLNIYRYHFHFTKKTILC